MKVFFFIVECFFPIPVNRVKIASSLNKFFFLYVIETQILIFKFINFHQIGNRKTIKRVETREWSNLICNFSLQRKKDERMKWNVRSTVAPIKIMQIDKVLDNFFWAAKTMARDWVIRKIKNRERVTKSQLYA